MDKYALLLNPLARGIEEVLPPRIANSIWCFMFLRTALVISTLGVAFLVPFFGVYSVLKRDYNTSINCDFIQKLAPFGFGQVISKYIISSIHCSIFWLQVLWWLWLVLFWVYLWYIYTHIPFMYCYLFCRLNLHALLLILQFMCRYRFCQLCCFYSFTCFRG